MRWSETDGERVREHVSAKRERRKKGERRWRNEKPERGNGEKDM